MQTVKYPIFRKLVDSPYLDVFGALLVLGGCVYRNFLGTIFFEGELQFGIPLSELGAYVGNGAFPLGVFSTVGAIFSLMATRLVGRQNNMGNIIGVVTTVNSGAIDFMFGNASAVITYPFTFFIHMFAVKRWSMNKEIRKRDTWYYMFLIAGMVVAFFLVYLGAYLFGGNQDSTFLTLVAIIFGLSLGGTICNVFKYEETWFSWVIYNIVQLWKNLIQLNVANVIKYLFYLFNAFITLVDWKMNGKQS